MKTAVNSWTYWREMYNWNLKRAADYLRTANGYLAIQDIPGFDIAMDEYKIHMAEARRINVEVLMRGYPE